LAKAWSAIGWFCRSSLFLRVIFLQVTSLLPLTSMVLLVGSPYLAPIRHYYFPDSVTFAGGSVWKPEQWGECVNVFWRDQEHPTLEVLPPFQMEMTWTNRWS
jgi:hypothetical protein